MEILVLPPCLVTALKIEVLCSKLRPPNSGIWEMDRKTFLLLSGYGHHFKGRTVAAFSRLFFLRYVLERMR